MFRKVLFTIFLIGFACTQYASYELTRYVLEYVSKYGEFTVGFLTWRQELAVIWWEYFMGMALLGMFVWYYLWGKR